MKVSALIEILEDCDPDADVYVMSQQGYPFEHSLYGVALREELTEMGEDEPSVEPRRAEDRWTAPDSELPRNDVFLVEGSQLRYGSKVAWEAARRG